MSIIPKLIENIVDEDRPKAPRFGEADRAARYNEGKPKWSFVDFDALEPMVRVLEQGAKKYSPDNWKNGQSTTELMESLMRHYVAYMRGEDNDPESGLPHIGHILCNAMFVSYMMLFKPEFDDRLEDHNKLPPE